MPLPGEHYGPELVKHGIEDACAELRAGGGDDGRIPRMMMSIRIMAPARRFTARSIRRRDFTGITREPRKTGAQGWGGAVLALQ
jgi:hypothetical protein